MNQEQAACDPICQNPGESRHRSRKSSQLIFYFFLSAPWLILVLFVLRYGVNVPFADDWFLTWFLTKVHEGHASLADFWELNLEHRVFFPRLLWAGSALLTHYDLRVEMWISALCGLAVFVALAVLAFRCRAKAGATRCKVAIFTTGCLVFSLVQYENWLWGFQLAFLLVHAFFCAAVLGISLERLPGSVRIFLAGCGCVGASYSSAHGLSSWLCLVPCVWFVFAERRARIRAVCGWLLLFAAATLVYFVGYRRPDAILPDPGFARQEPGEAALYFLAVLGAPFAHVLESGNENFAVVLGALILAVFATLSVVAWRGPSAGALSAWLAVGLFGLAFAALNTIGRGGWGLHRALTVSRYTTVPILTTVAIVNLLAFLPKLRRGNALALFLLCSGGILMLVVLNSVFGMQQAHDLRVNRLRAALALKLVTYIDRSTDPSRDGLLFASYPYSRWSPIFPEWAEQLDKLGFLQLIRDLAFVDPERSPGTLDTIRPAESRTSAGQGGVLSVSPDQKIVLEGTINLAKQQRSPTLVLITRGDEHVFISGVLIEDGELLYIGKHRHDQHQRWMVILPGSFLHAGANKLSAWWFDPERHAVFRLKAMNNTSVVAQTNLLNGACAEH